VLALALDLGVVSVATRQITTHYQIFSLVKISKIELYAILRRVRPEANAKRRARRRGRSPRAIRYASEQISEDISVWRRLRGLTQAQLADRAGVGRVTVARLEKGDGGASLESLLRVLRALGVLDPVLRALDPYESDVGRLRADEALPQRIRPRDLTDLGDE
jgi:transcriptional regulator with XRE-family HTH domain